MKRRQMVPSWIAAEVAAALMKQPLTLYGLAQVIGLNRTALSTPKRYVEQFHAAGCVRIVGRSRGGASVYRWQPSLFAEADSFDRIVTKERNA